MNQKFKTKLNEPKIPNPFPVNNKSFQPEATGINPNEKLSSLTLARFTQMIIKID